MVEILVEGLRAGGSQGLELVTCANGPKQRLVLQHQ